MKIHFFCASLTFSGGRLAMFRHANELARRGHEVSVWTETSQTEPGLGWFDLQVPLRHASSSDLRAVPRADACVFDRTRLAEPLLKAGIGRIVHLCQGYEGTDARIRRHRAWSEQGVLGLPEVWRQWRRLSEVNRAYCLPTAKIVTHRHLGELIARLYGQPSYFVPYGLPDNVFGPSAARREKAATVLVVGPTDTGWKCVPDALRAVQRLKQARPDIRLIRVAQHPMRDVERDLNVTDEYHTMLAPSQMANLYRRADVMLISSNATEGFGLPMLEAMACGLPCVATDIPAFRTFAERSDYACFVPVGDSARMADMVAGLLASPQERDRLRRRGLEVASEYTLPRSYDTMESALRMIIAGSPPSERTIQAAA